MLDFITGAIFGVVVSVVSYRVLPWFKRSTKSLAEAGSILVGGIAGGIVDVLVRQVIGVRSFISDSIGCWFLGILGGFILYYASARVITRDYSGTGMPSRLKITIVVLNVGAALSVVMGLIAIVIGSGEIETARVIFPGIELSNFTHVYSLGRTVAILMGLLLIFLVAPLIRYVSQGLKNLQYWAWLSGLMISGLMIFNGLRPPYIPTVLGGLALWGLLDKETLAVFLPRNVADRETEKPR